MIIMIIMVNNKKQKEGRKRRSIITCSIASLIEKAPRGNQTHNLWTMMRVLYHFATTTALRALSRVVAAIVLEVIYNDIGCKTKH